LQRQLLHSQKLEALGTLAGGVAHELNNALVPVLALSKLVLESLPEDSPERDDLALIVSSSERARDLVKQILSYSRKQDRVEQIVDLADLIREALRMLRVSLPATIRIGEAIEAVPAVAGDPGELHQLIVNLVTNAAQAIGASKGMITVALALIGGNVRLSVIDNGCGMDSVTVDRIFEPFFTTKDVGEGTGLGLSVVHSIVTRHGGQIQVRSHVGEGTVFEVLLPAFAAVEAMAA